MNSEPESGNRIDGMATRIAGRGGLSVLWIHGYTLDSSIWQELWERLPGYRHIGLDLPGHGDSEPMDPSTDLPSLANRIGTSAARLGARHLVGLSFGGMVALQVAIQFPKGFDSLIVGSPSLGGGPVDPESMTCNVDLERLYKERGPGPWLRERWMRCPPRIFESASTRPPLFARLAEVVNQHTWEELSDHRMGRLTRHVQSARDLARIQAASIILVGEYDIPSFKRCAELVRRNVPGATREYVPGAGHLSLIESVDYSAERIGRHIDAILGSS